METVIFQILLALGYLQLKHLAADFFLQTPWQFRNKGTYGHPGGLVHAGIHAALTLPVLAIVPASGLALAGLVVAGEFVIHYHTDWAKENVNRTMGWGTDKAGFWQTFGFDQFVHQATYLLIVAALVWL